MPIFFMADARVVTWGAPMLPDPDRLASLMGEAIAAGRLANGGTLHDRLERALEERSGGCRVTLTSSGTMAVMLALRLGHLPEGAEVVTTPLSFAATVQAIAWCGLRPVFADVEPDTLTLCPRAVEAAITPRTAAILPVHLLGVPCDVEALAAVAQRHGLWLVYDAAHAFGLTVDGRPIARYGEASAFSLHATKLLHTGEGGFVATGSEGARDRLRRMRNFGLDAGRLAGPGINGKLSEIQAALGLALLPDLTAEMAARDALRAHYDAAFTGAPGIRVHPTRQGASRSLTFYALRVAPAARERALRALADANIHGRGHFPLLCGPGTPYSGAPIATTRRSPIAPAAGPELLSLPFHGRVTSEDARMIASIVRQCSVDEGHVP